MPDTKPTRKGLGAGWLTVIVIALCAMGGLGWFVLGRTSTRGTSPTATSIILPAVPTDEAGLRAISRDAQWLARGKQVYDGMCWTCHGRSGEGGQGPNLRDAAWIIEPTMTGMITVIRDGRPGTAMQAMRDWYKPEEIAAVAAYVANLHREPEVRGGKAAEGLHNGIDW